MDAQDLLNENSILPELSFEDLLAFSPIKKTDSNSDSMEFEDDEKKTDEDTLLNTPGPKTKTKVVMKTTTATIPDASTSTTTIATAALNATKLEVIPIRSSNLTNLGDKRKVVSMNSTNEKIYTYKPVKIIEAPATTTESSTTTTTKTTMTNFLIKSPRIVPTNLKHLVRVTPKNIITTTNTTKPTITATTTATTKVTPMGKTAVKTANGNIFFINNAIGGAPLPVVRLQAKSAAAIAANSNQTNATSTATTVTLNKPIPTTTATTTPTTVNANKTVTVIRTHDGKYVPLKTAVSNTITTATPTTIPPVTAKVISGNKIISTTNAVPYVFKSISTTTTANTQSTTTSTTPTTPTTKIIYKANIIPKTKPITSTTINVTTTTATATAKQFSKIIPITTTATKTTNDATFPVKTFTIQRVNATGTTKGSPSTIIKIPNMKTTTTTTTTIITPTTNSTTNAVNKQVVVSNQNVMKISAGGTNTTPNTNTNPMAGKLQAVRIPGKPGVQYVRFLSTPKVSAVKGATTITTTPTTTSTIKTIVMSKSTGKITSQNTNPTTTTISSHQLPPKAGGASSLNGSTIIIKKPVKDEVAVCSMSSGNVQAKVQKTIVSLPSGVTKISTPTKIVVKQATTLSPTIKNQLLLRKHKIETDSDEPEPKKPAISKHIVVVPAKLSSSLTESMKTEQKVKPIEPQIKQPVKALKPPQEVKVETDVKFHVSSKQHLQKANSNAPFKLNEELFGSTLAKIKEASKADDFLDDELMDRAILAKKNKIGKNKAVSIASDEAAPASDSNSATLVRRKHCNCSKSQCLKLYCDCFANGEFCQDCTCRDCCNNLKFEDERQRAIIICLERNPNAFKPKITSTDQGDASMRHKRGCNCKRSGCLKNYCECYEAKVPCTKYCKCVGCRNVDDVGDIDPLDPQAFATFKANVDKAINAANLKANQKRGNRRPGLDDDENEEDCKRDLADLGSHDNSDNEDPNRSSSAEKQPINFITPEVIGATVQCMLSQAAEGEKNHFPIHHVEKLVIEELGRCLVEIIDFSIRNTDSSFSQE